MSKLSGIDDTHRCHACGERRVEMLPIPNRIQSILSDGRIIARPLVKAICERCGLVSHVPPLAGEEIRSFYDENYNLGAKSSLGDEIRALNLGRKLVDLLDGWTPRRVMEIGSGGGMLLRVLADHWAPTEFVGLDAAPMLGRKEYEKGDRISFRTGFIETMPPSAIPFDLVISINVIEHAIDPVIFLKSAWQQLASSGKVLVVCPRLHPPNVELLFRDHIHTLSEQAFALLANRAGFDVVLSQQEVEGLGDFQLQVLQKTSVSGRGLDQLRYLEESATSLVGGPRCYLQSWQRLDEALIRRIGNASRIFIFGAGEMAALLRCYTPMTWSRAKALLVDSTRGARDLGLPLCETAELTAGPDGAIVVATHSRSQAGIAKKLLSLGWTTVTFHDLIER